ncbi:VanZ family protein [Stackebrandtia albiflava]|nr:VanZ family protein [Stackebrandtia albiflava]
MATLWERWGVVLTVTALALPVAAGVAAAATRRRRRLGEPTAVAWYRSCCEVGAVVGTVPWLWMVFTPADGPGGHRLVPLVDLVEVIGRDVGDAVVQIGGNLAVFAAAGFAAAARWRVPVRWIGVAALCAASAIEAAQAVLDIGRVSSVDDVLLNVCGALIAARLGRRLSVPAVAPA